MYRESRQFDHYSLNDVTMKGYVYILEMRNGKYYIWSTMNVERRFAEHSRGHVESTKNNRPLRLLYYKEFDTDLAAKRKEMRLKKQKSKKMIQQFMAL